MKPVQPPSLSPLAEQLRRAFDETFAAPPPPPAPPTRALLLVRAAGATFALPRDQFAGITRSRNVAPAPGGARDFLGLVEAQHHYYPVWSLAGLLGREVQPLASTAWLVLAEIPGADRCAFACEAVEQMISVPESDLIAPARPGEPAHARTPAGPVPLVEISTLHDGILKRKKTKQPPSTP